MSGINKQGFIHRTVGQNEKITKEAREKKEKKKKEEKTAAEVKKAKKALEKIKLAKGDKKTKIVDRSGNRAYA